MESFLVWILESSLLILLILGIRKIFMGKIRYTAIYALWALVLVRFLIPVNFFSTPFSIGTIVSETVSTWAGEKGGKEPAALERQNLYDNAAAAGHTKAGTLQGVSANIKTAEPSEAEIKEDIPDAPKAFPNAGWTIGDGTKKMIFGGWLSVSLILLMWFGVSNINLNHRLRKKRILYGKRGQIGIYLVSGIKNPCLYGFLRPAIYLPASFVNNGSAQVEDKEELGQMITHEYVHYCHKDHIWAMFRILLISFYWFDPFMWLAVFCSKRDAELACDETVIRRLGERKRFSYGEMLVRLAADTGWGDFRYSMMAMSRKGKEMEKRILAISVYKRYSKWILIPLTAIVLFTAGITCSTGIGQVAGEQVSSDPDIKTKQGSIAFGFDQVFENRGVETGSYEEVFYRYIEFFTTAVNTGNVDAMKQVLAEESDVYRQQCAMAKNYHKRGIREKVQACSIANVREQGMNKVLIESKEKIKATYADATSKIIDQSYLYMCEKSSQGWRITRMGESKTSPYAL